MSYTEREVMQYILENDVKFVKLTFCDTFGKQKNVSLVASELDSVFASGLSFDAEYLEDFAGSGLPLRLFPDPSTLYMLPWRPQAGRVVSLLCDVRYADGTPYECDSRSILAGAIKRLDALKLDCKVGTACEFYVLKSSELDEPQFVPYDTASYCDAAPIDKCENLRRDIILSLETMGIDPISSHHERGKGQNSVVFKSSDAMSAAKNILTYKSAVRNVCVRDGVYATFMPKPFDDDYGSGLHISFSVARKGGGKSLDHGDLGKFTEGILSRAAEITAFTDSSVNSYRRFAGLEAAHTVGWARQGNESLISALGEQSSVTLRSPDNACNPFIALALLLHAGLDGVEKGATLREENVSCGELPSSLGDALDLANASEFVKRHLPPRLLERFTASKRREIERAKNGGIDAERALYIDC